MVISKFKVSVKIETVPWSKPVGITLIEFDDRISIIFSGLCFVAISISLVLIFINESLTQPPTNRAKSPSLFSSDIIFLLVGSFIKSLWIELIIYL